MQSLTTLKDSIKGSSFTSVSEISRVILLYKRLEKRLEVGKGSVVLLSVSVIGSLDFSCKKHKMESRKESVNYFTKHKALRDPTHLISRSSKV